MQYDRDNAQSVQKFIFYPLSAQHLYAVHSKFAPTVTYANFPTYMYVRIHGYEITCLHSVCKTQLDGELLLAPGFAAPPNSDYQGYHTYIDEHLPPETPYLYGLHPNAEIGFLTTTSESLFRTILEMQPRDSSGAGGGGATREEQVGYALCMCVSSTYV